MGQWAEISNSSISNSEDGAPGFGSVMPLYVVCNLALANTSQMQVDNLVAPAAA